MDVSPSSHVLYVEDLNCHIGTNRFLVLWGSQEGQEGLVAQSKASRTRLLAGKRGSVTDLCQDLDTSGGKFGPDVHRTMAGGKLAPRASYFDERNTE